MKKLLLTVLLGITMLTSCAGQKEVVTSKKVLNNALVSQVYNNVATITQNGRTFEVDGTSVKNKYIKGRKYYTIIEVVDCHKCEIPLAVAKVVETSIEQNRKDIEEAIKKYHETVE